MRTVKDSFVSFLSEGLSTDSIPVHYVRVTKDDQDAGSQKTNAVNVKFLDMNFGGLRESTLAVIDVIHDDDNTADDWVAKVITVLTNAYYTPLQDYTDPDNPTAVGGRVFWEQPVQFNPVTAAGYYVHLSAKVRLFHH